jgi:DNA-binding LacI/PurR family transcriptional regulator
VYAVSDHEAEFIYDAAAELGLKIPDDLSVISFADLDFAAMMSPPLTTMRQKPHEIGRLAARLIMDRIDGLLSNEDEPTTIKVEADLIVRGSTAKPRG